MAFSTNGAKGLSSEINVTPLIDVLLVLLIIFMVIVPLAPLGMESTLPQPANPHNPTPQADTPIVVQLQLQDADPLHPTYRINGVPVTRDALDAHLRDLLAVSTQRQMLVQGDARLEYGAISNVVDAGRAAGADTVGLLTPATATQ